MLQILTILFPVIAGTAVSRMKISGEKYRNVLYTVVLVVTDIFCLFTMLFAGRVSLFTIASGTSLAFAPDPLGRFCLAAVMLLYTAVCFYSFEYMKMEERPEVFFAFFFISFGALIAVCLSANLVTLYFCFELATLTSVPLVLHEMTKEAVAAGLKYLFYSIGGALIGLLAVFFVHYYAAGDVTFRLGGFVDPGKMAGAEGIFLAAVFIGIVGFGTKAGMYPMHGWLPTAHPIAPAPASALLSGIIAKAGVIAIIRLVYYSVGAQLLRGTWVQYAWMGIAMLTIFMGSMMAFREKIVKKRLAYSTISQISYILLALSTLSENGLKGGLIHLLSHAASKGCLFLTAGIFIYKLGIREVGQLRGIGKKMPVTMWCFMIAALSLVGIPPMGGFLSKWVIAGAVIQNGEGILSVLPCVVLLISALLTAGYLFPIAIDAFFPGKDREGEEETADCEPPLLMTAPLAVLCAAALAAGVFGLSLVRSIP